MLTSAEFRGYTNTMSRGCSMSENLILEKSKSRLNLGENEMKDWVKLLNNFNEPIKTKFTMLRLLLIQILNGEISVYRSE